MKEVKFDPKKVFFNSSCGSSRGIRCDTKEKASTFLDWLIKYLKKDFGHTLVWGDNDLVKAERPFYEGSKMVYYISDSDGKLRYSNDIHATSEALSYEEALLGGTIAAPPTSIIDKNKVFPSYDFRDSVSVHCDTEDKAKSYINWLVEHFKADGRNLKWSCGSDIANKKGNITEYCWCYYGNKTCYSVTATGRVVYAPLGNNVLVTDFPYDKVLSSGSSNKKAVPNSELEVGDRVIFVKNDVVKYYINKSNPLIGTEHECEGVVEGIRADHQDQSYFIHVLWDNGSRNKYENYTLAKVESETEAKPKKEGTMVEFDFASFVKGEFGVRCTTEDQARELFVILKDNDIFWNDGEKCTPLGTRYFAPEEHYNCDGRKLFYARDHTLEYKDFSNFMPTAQPGKNEADEVTFDLSLFNSGNAMRCKNAEQETAFLKYLGKKGIRRKSGEICSPDRKDKYCGNNMYYALELEGLDYVLIHGDATVNPRKRKILPYEHFVIRDKSASTKVAEADPVEIVEFDPEEIGIRSIDGRPFTLNYVHCRTEQEAKNFLTWLERYCVKKFNYFIVWKDGGVPIIQHKDDTVYYITEGTLVGRSLPHTRHRVISYEDALLENSAASCVDTVSKEEHMIEFDLSEFTENLGIHCKTEEQARTFFTWLNSINALWRGSELCEPNRTNYSIYKDRTVYFIELRGDRKEVCFDSINFSYKRHKPYENFLKGNTELKTPDDLKYNVEDPNVQFTLSKFAHNVGIHCRTGEQARTFFYWLDSLDAVWLQNGCACHSLSTGYDRYRENTVYFLSSNQCGSLVKRTVTYKPLVDVQSHFGEYYPYEHFLENKDTKTTIRKEQPMKASTIAVKGKENVKKAAATSKNAILQAQEGTALLAAVKAGLNKGPLPVQMKEVLNTPAYGDFIVGLLLDVIVPTVTSSKKAAEVTQAANIVASTNLSGQFTWLQDLMRTVVEKTVPDMSFSKDK